MAERKPSARGPDSSEGLGRYYAESKRPIQALAFLLPLIVAYELCLALLLPAGDGLVNTVEAHRTLLRFFGVFGIHATGGLYIGGLVIVLVMLAWHVLSRDAWQVNVAMVGVMALEAAVLTIPLLVISQVIAERFAGAIDLVGAVTGPSGPGRSAPSFDDLDVWSQMAISVGAGLYEELIFRMVLIALVHTMLVDLARVRHATGVAVAILVSAVAFTTYHDLRGATGAISPRRVVFYFLAGLYFGAVFTFRGFGLVVGCHALYDVITVLLATRDDGS